MLRRPPSPLLARLRSHLGLARARRRPGFALQAGAAVPEKPDQGLRLLSLNLAHGRGPRQSHMRRPRLERHLNQVAEALRAMEPDVVALQEADGPSAWSGNFDHVATLAELAELQSHVRGEHNHFGTPRFNLKSGTAILARYPLLDPISHRFADSWRDTKGFVLATVEVPQWGGRQLDVVSVHLDFLLPGARRRQIAQLVEALGQRRNPLVLLGDLNCCFTREPRSIAMLARSLGLQAFEPAWHAPTYPALRPARRLDWILISSELHFCGYGTLPVPISDHLMVAADLMVEPLDS